MRYKFCKANGCWWLVINDLKQFLEYKDKTNSKYGHALIRGIYGEEDNPYQQLYNAAEAIAKTNRVSLLEGMSRLAGDMMSIQLDAILDGKTLWFNENGGYNYGLDDLTTATTYRDKLLFPNYTEKDIRISRWGNGGQHFYAKVGEIEVKDIIDGEINNDKESLLQMTELLLKGGGD